MPRKSTWEPDDPRQHWPDRNDVKDRFERAKRGLSQGEDAYFSLYYIGSSRPLKKSLASGIVM